MDYPLLGVGFGRHNQQVLLAKYLPSSLNWGSKVLHNTYLQAAVDSGMFAFLLYMALMIGALLWLFVVIQKTRKTDPQTAAAAKAMESSILVFAVGSCFLSRVDYDMYYMMLMCVAVLYEIRKEQKLGLQQPELAMGDTPAMLEPAHMGMGGFASPVLGAPEAHVSKIKEKQPVPEQTVAGMTALQRREKLRGVRKPE